MQAQLAIERVILISVFSSPPLRMTFPLQRYSDWALLFLRLVIGIIFLYHGWAKWSMEDANLMMTILQYVEPIGGLALIVGVLTQFASLGLAIIMVGAIYMKASGFGQAPLDLLGTFADGSKWEFDLVLLAGCVLLLVMGAGSLSVDAIMKKKTQM